MVYFLELSAELAKEWDNLCGMRKVSDIILEKDYVSEHFNYVDYVYNENTKLINILEDTYLAPVCVLRHNLVNWSIFSSKGLFIIDIHDILDKYQLEYLKTNNISFICKEETSNDEFANKYAKLYHEYTEAEEKENVILGFK